MQTENGKKILVKENLKEGERAIIVGLKGGREFQSFLLSNGISLGTIVTKNFSPSFSKLINITIGAKMLSLRESDFEMIEMIKI